jgi:hypothetical protein
MVWQSDRCKESLLVMSGLQFLYIVVLCWLSFGQKRGSIFCVYEKSEAVLRSFLCIPLKFSAASSFLCLCVCFLQT